MTSIVSRIVYHAVRGLARIIYPGLSVEGAGELPDEATIVVGNHAQMYGPIAANVYFPGKKRIWCSSEMMHMREVPAYAYRDFWSNKPKSVRWFFRLLSYAIAPIASCVFNNAGCIAVYRDMRAVNTLKNTVRALEEGARVIIFPEHEAPYNHILYQFQEHFVDVARLYVRRTHRPIWFAPMYLAPGLHRLVIGKAIRFDPDAPLEEERKRICTYLMQSITQTACSLPRHLVVPYANLPRKLYRENKPPEDPKE